ncbi:MAG: hypothetical protein methR_P0382 [Methyloprofundus sp.]|nr:MAG: hypothetical protein methR_P0382 [Methyloprofundus sp.]
MERNMQHQDIIDNSNKQYDQRGKQYPGTSKAVFWDDQQTQYLRFHEIVKHMDLGEHSTVLDVGCGNAELYKYLNFNGFKGEYKGYDINEELLNQARKMYPDIVVAKLDILAEPINERFDYVVLSGLFNLNYGQNIEWVEQMLTVMYGLANKKMIFNAISSYVNYQQDEMFYINPSTLLDFVLRNLSTQVVLEHGALPYNYLMAVDNSKNWQSLNL